MNFNQYNSTDFNIWQQHRKLEYICDNKKKCNCRKFKTKLNFIDSQKLVEESRIGKKGTSR